MADLMEKPKHTKAQSFLRQKLLHGISCFGELESRISALETAQERGEAFEVFAEAYLATQHIVQAEEIWPFESIPQPIKERFSLDTEVDTGVDGMFKSLLGEC